MDAVFPSEMSDPIVEKFAGPGGSLPAQMVPLKRMGSEEDMAGAVLYLTSKAGGYCNGLVIITDGGRLGAVPNTY
jgi:NAD(P)-dependent dehydrogenase (short-subunit alcohol dehydrogenase family)